MNETQALTLRRVLTAEIPGLEWDVGDDLCDCMFQQIGFWTNPYFGKTLRMRFCCLWKELAKDYPQFVQEVDGFYNQNIKGYEQVRDWDAEFDMPRGVWYRHLSTKLNLPLPEVREQYRDQEPPKGVRRWKSPSRKFSKFTVNLR